MATNSTRSSQNATLTPEQYIRERVEYKIGAYTKKGERYRWGYILMACTATVGAASVPVLINLKNVDSIYPTLISLLVTILVGVEGLLHFCEHWRNYDLMKSFLRQEHLLFCAGAGVYRKENDETAFRLFVERIEGEIARERSQTIEMRTTREVHTETQTDGKSRPGSDASKTTARNE